MQTWAKRGIQSALVTGGLLMLGTGIASAQENVNPDTPPSTIDGGITVPIDLAHDAFSAPVGQLELPEFHHEVASDQLASTNPLIRNPAGLVETINANRGNVVQPNAITPVNACGNGVVAGYDATLNTTCSPTATQPEAEAGSETAAAVVDTVLTPREIGDGSELDSLSGSIDTAQDAVPSQAVNDTIEAVDHTRTELEEARDAIKSVGSLKTNGDQSFDSGAIDPATQGWPSSQEADDLPTWTGAGDNPATSTGNAVQPQAAGPVWVDDDAFAAYPSASGRSLDGPGAGDFTSATDVHPTLSGDLADHSGGGNAASEIGNPTAEHADDLPTSNPVPTFGDPVGAGKTPSNVDSALDFSAVGDAVGDSVDSALDLPAVADAVDDSAEGVVAGDVVRVPEASALQAFADVVGVDDDATTDRAPIPGGDTTSTALGKDASVSGDLVELPSAAADAFNGPVPDGALPDTTLISDSGGETLTGYGDLTTDDISAPVESSTRVYDVPAEVLDTSLSNVYAKAPQLTPEETEAANLARGVQIPKTIDSLLGSGDLPGLSGLTRLPVQRDALAQRSYQHSEAAPLPELPLPYALMRGGVRVPAEVLGTALRTAPVKAAQLTAEETEAANLARGVQIPKSIDSLLTSTDVPNLTAFAIPTQRGPLTSRLPEAPTVRGVPVPVGQTARQISDAAAQAGRPAPSGRSVSGHGVAVTGESLPVQPRFMVGQTSDAAALTKMTVPRGSYFDKVSDMSGSDTAGQTERAVNKLSDTAAETSLPVPHQHVNLTEERSFSGLLPISDDTGFGAVPVIRSLVPLNTGRNLTATPSFPFAAPAMPVILPVVPVAQPRAFSEGIPLDGVQLNPTSSYMDIPAFPVGQRSYRAPALAGLDTRTMFGSLDDTVQFERVQ